MVVKKMKPAPQDKVTETPSSKYWLDSSGVLYLVMNGGNVSIDEHKKLSVNFKQNYGGKKYCAIIDISSFSSVSKELRDFNANELPTLFHAIAFVSRSPLGSMAAHLYMGNKKIYFRLRFSEMNKAPVNGWGNIYKIYQKNEPWVIRRVLNVKIAQFQTVHIVLRKYPYILSLLFLCSNLMAQRQINGSVTDSLNKPVPFCVIALLNQGDSSLVKGALTDENGSFEFSTIPTGTFSIKINQAGYMENRINRVVVDSLSRIKLDPIVLKKGVELEEVTISAIREPIEFKGGNITVNVENSPLATGNSAYDLLQRLPGVMIENDNISIQGRSGVILYIDDRIQPMSGAQLINFLRGLNASAIEKIEIISNPSSKYDAAGNAGIINIKLKKIKVTGFSGSAVFAWSQGYYRATNGSFSLNYKGRMVSFFSNLTYSEGIRRNVTVFNRAVTYENTTTQLDQTTVSKSFNSDEVINFGVDWYVSKNTTLGAKFQGIPGYAFVREDATLLLSDSTEGYRQMKTIKTTPNDWYLANYNVNSEHTLDSNGTKLKFSADAYGPYFDDYASHFENRYTNAAEQNVIAPSYLLSDNNLDLRLFTSKLDFEKKFKNELELEAGIKGSYMLSSSDYNLKRRDLSGTYVTDSAFTNKFFYTEIISATYFMIRKQYKKFNTQLGLRAEDTDIHTDTYTGSIKNKQKYTNVFPSLSVDYNATKDHILSASYNKRIERPHYNVYNPYRSFVNPLTSSMGNPYVRPAFTHNYRFSYVWKNSVFNTISYTNYDSPLMGYPVQNDSTKESTWITDNFEDFNIVRYDLFIKKNIKKWWSLSFLLGAYYIDYKGKVDGKDISMRAIPHYEWINNIFLLPKNYKVEVSAFYWGPWLGGVNRYRSRWGLNMAFKKSFMDNNLNVSLAVNDVFFTETFRSYTDFENQKWERYDSYDRRRVIVGVSYNFGKIKAEQRRLESSQEEKGRLGR